MDPLIAVAVALVPDLVKLIAGDKAGTFSQKVVDTVKTVTQTADQSTAQAKVDGDPAAKAQLQKDLAALALEAMKEQNRAEETKRSIELDVLKEEIAEAARLREDNINRFREEMKSSQDARAFYTNIAASGSAYGWVNPALSMIITLGFLSLIFLLLFGPAVDKNEQVFNIALGALATAFATVIGFHFGSSMGSKEKDQVNKALMTEQVVRREEQRIGDAGGGDADNGPSGGPMGRKAGSPAGGGGPTGDTDLFSTKAPKLMKLLIQEFKLTDFQAGGALGNIGWECDGFRTYQEIGVDPPNGGWGICQWTGPRRRAFEKWAKDQGFGLSSDEANFGFLILELQTTEKAALAHLKKTSGLEEATKSFMDKFERPGAPHLSGRLVWARRAMDAFS